MHQRSFVEQLENVFCTPVGVGMQYNFNRFPGAAVLPLPHTCTTVVAQDKMVKKQKSTLHGSLYHDFSLPMDVESTMLLGSHKMATSEDFGDGCLRILTANQNRCCCPLSKFGGKPSPPQPEQVKQEPPLTLSDIIPPPSHIHAMANAPIVEDVIKQRRQEEALGSDEGYTLYYEEHIKSSVTSITLLNH